MQHFNVLVAHRRRNIGWESFWLSPLNLTDIPFNSNSREIFDGFMLNVFLSKGGLILKNIIQKVG